MAYDAATRTVVLFGGQGPHGVLGDTWTWDGTTWTQQRLAAHPPARSYAAMAYDPAPGTVVLFGGGSGSTRLKARFLFPGGRFVAAVQAHRVTKSG
jgi:hypothetical protein